MDTGDPQRTPELTGWWPPRRAVALAMSCHPGPVAAVTGLAVALGVCVGLGATGCLLIGAAVLTGQLSVGWCNDAFDARRDIAAGRRDKPVAVGSLGRGTVWRAAFTALLLCVPLSLACGPASAAVHLTAVAAAWSYNLRLKTTALSWLPYVVGFGGLPAVVTLSLPARPWPEWWVLTAGALLGVAAHLGDVLPDLEGDLREGVRGLPQRLGATGIRLLLPVPLLAATAVLVLGPQGSPGGGGVATLGAAALMAFAGPVLGRYWSRAPFVGTVAVAAVDVTLLLVQGTALV
ncbi:UbiA family prenyltransferase [Streptomyces sp. AM 4-1-1]|uniref:UbiA family prenyltransferase n=1 Tax=Streptomyces sp. AM 4-1-1 TaxID=3028710 RepID=UPI0023B8866C|nr:UbiA family prenyltransferase [Streptomyces sp. AM 4-1-1]WEH32217.1 UbiA family prenyltransferase [Streptomyces sp. AM 4-1-1]